MTNPNTTTNDNKSMDSRLLLASLLSSLVSELLVVLLFLFPNTPTHVSPPPSNLFPLVFNLLSSSEIATSLPLLQSSNKKKRKRLLSQSPSPSSSPSSEEQQKKETEIENESDHSFSSSGVSMLHIDPFKVCFRMTSSTFEWLTGLLEPLLECRDPLGSPLNLPAEIRLGIGLFRLASGSNYVDIARRFDVSESIARFCTKQLCRVLCTNFRFWVAFPNSNELESVSSSFEHVSGFPNCCGVIDCSRFRIKRTNGQEESFVAQIVVDSSSRILNIVAGFRGRKGDSRVLKGSTLYKDVEEGRVLNGSSVDTEGVSVPQYLIGDGGYPLLPWLMVPFIDPVHASGQEEFNKVLQKMRLPGLRTFASLKNWGILGKPIEEEYKTAVACIGACSILHNALLLREDSSALSEEMLDYSVQDQCSDMEEHPTVNNGSLIRNALLTRLKKFPNLNHPVSC